MRNELEYIARIEHYLLKQMSSTEQTAFAQEMSNDSNLANDVRLQQDLMKGMERSLLKAEISKAQFNYRLMKWLITSGIVVAIAAALVLAGWLALGNKESERGMPEQQHKSALMLDSKPQTSADTIVINDSIVPATENVLPDSIQTNGASTVQMNSASPMAQQGVVEKAESIVKSTANSLFASDVKMTKESDERMADADMYLEPQKFQLQLDGPHLVETTDGILIAYDKDCFVNSAGNAVNENVEMIVREAIEPVDIMKSGLSTVSGKQDLQTAGMFQINAYSNGEKLKINPEKPLAVSMPGNGLCEDLMLWDGVVKKDGTIDWQNPTQIEQFLTPVDIETLDFYPPNFLTEVTKYGFSNSTKSVTDSIYLSFENYNALSESDLSKDLKAVMDTNFVEDAFDKSRRNFYGSRGYKMAPIFMSENNEVSASYSIQPSKVLAMWCSDFSSTNIATHEFEQRMKLIHQTCNAQVLHLYLDNLDKQLWVIDNMAANLVVDKKLSAKFESFAARKEGRVQTDDTLVKTLYKNLQEREGQYRQKAEMAMNELQQKTKQLYAERGRMSSDDDKRAQRELRESFQSATLQLYADANLKYVPSNLLSANNTITAIGANVLRSNSTDNASFYASNKSAARSPRRNTFRVRRVGWSNVDALFGPGKFITINKMENGNTGGKLPKAPVLEDIEVTIKNPSTYDQIFVYLIPQGTSNFKRVRKVGELYQGEVYKELKYDLVVIAHHGALIYADIKKDIKPGKHLFNALLPRFDDDLKEMLSDYYQMLNDDTRHQQELLIIEEEIKKIESDAKMRRELEWVVFPCRYVEIWDDARSGVIIDGYK